MWVKNVLYDLEIETVTGLHIGGSSEGLKIGGTDMPVITVATNRNGKMLDIPYIPGSSIKGRVRSLLLAVYGKIENRAVKFTDGDLDKLFGMANAGTGNDGIRTRSIFRDAMPSEDDLKKWFEGERSLTEIKGENTIDPISGEAKPRYIERVIPGVKFLGEIVLQIQDNDNLSKLERYLFEGMKLLEDTYLGGQGTRGYGKVKITIKKRGEYTIEAYRKESHTGLEG